MNINENKNHLILHIRYACEDKLFVLAYLLGIAVLAYLFPGLLPPIPIAMVLWAGCSGGDCGGCAGAASSGGGAGPGCSSDSGSDSGSGSCGQCADSGCSGNPGGPPYSTPFLQQLQPDNTYKTLNDVMVGNPTSFFNDLTEGEKQFKAGNVGRDIYTLPADSLSSFRLKEIEFETSNIAEFSYGFLNIPQGRKICSGHEHHRLFTVSHHSPLPTSPVHSNKNKTPFSITDNIAKDTHEERPFSESWSIDPGEEVRLKVPYSENGKTYLSVATFWRTLNAGHSRAVQLTEQRISKIKSPFFRRVLTPIAYVLAILFPLGMSPMATNVIDADLTSKVYSIPTAHASVPTKNSVYLFYRAQDGSWKEFAIIHPRFALSHKHVVEVPAEAFLNHGEADISIRTNRTHYLYGIGIAKGIEEVTLPELTPITGIKNDREEITPSLSNRLITNPGDDFTFQLEKPKTATHLVFALHGHYAAKVPQDQKEVSRWWDRLNDSEKVLWSV